MVADMPWTVTQEYLDASVRLQITKCPDGICDYVTLEVINDHTEHNFCTLRGMRRCLDELAMGHGFSVKQARSQSKARKWICTREGCPFLLIATVRQDASVRISSMQLAHNHPLHHENVQRRHNGVSHNKVVRSVLESEAAGKDARKLTANDIKDSSRAKQAIVNATYGEVDESIEKLEAYFDVIRQHNPGTFTVVETDGGHFRRSVIVPAFCKHAVKHCQPVLALDGAHLKDMMHSNGVLLVASMKDPNNHIVVIGLGIARQEDGPNWSWFLKSLKTAGVLDSEDLVIISDRQKGLIKACNDVVPNIPHRFCLRHVIANIRSTKGLSLSSSEEALVFRMANADSSDTFDRLAETLACTNPGAFNYLTANTLPRTSWVTYSISMPTYGYVTSNLSESANHWLGKDLRSSNVVQLHFQYLLHLLRNIMERRDKSRNWPDGNLTPIYNSKFSKMTLGATSIELAPIEPRVEFLALYHNESAIRSHLWRRVHLGERSCDCGEWYDKQHP
ncbi:hypothetical protein AeRB84_010517, partial [Aphanomyces euteiches]